MLRRLRTAQSLLEAILAIGVILVATISSATLIVSTVFASSVSRDRIEATNLAREGFEVVREIRDSNWMKRAENVVDGSGTTVLWDDTGSTTDGYEALDSIADTNFGRCRLPIFDPTTGWSLPVDTSDGQEPCLVGGGPLTNDKIYIITLGDLTYMTNKPSVTNCPDGATCTSTKYIRAVSIKKVTTDLVTGEYLEVTSTVKWNSHGNKQVEYKERLYDWR